MLLHLKGNYKQVPQDCSANLGSTELAVESRNADGFAWQLFEQPVGATGVAASSISSITHASDAHACVC